MVGRTLIGLGVAAGLMAGFKAIVLCYPAERRAVLNGWMMMLGSLGAVTATVPADLLLDAIGWRGLFAVMAGLSALAALLILTRVPNQDLPRRPPSSKPHDQEIHAHRHRSRAPPSRSPRPGRDAAHLRVHSRSDRCKSTRTARVWPTRCRARRSRDRATGRLRRVRYGQCHERPPSPRVRGRPRTSPLDRTRRTRTRLAADTVPCRRDLARQAARVSAHPDAPLQATEATRIDLAMARTYGGDRQATDMARALRLAGSWHLKGDSHPVRLRECPGTGYTAHALRGAFPQPPPQAAQHRRATPAACSPRYRAA